MRTEKWLVLCVVLLLIQLVACERGKMEENAPAPVSARTGVDSAQVDSIRPDTIGTDSIISDSVYQDTVVRDSTIADSSFLDTLGAGSRTGLTSTLKRLKTIH
ncbi:hypothetical protein [Dyadobacter sp. 676]|uniref:Uncharacterized protein n=1 Tax=Dyadobacter sp. 676 TaxID=3088362 RepID=A0AAU8FF71_9BACT